MTHRRSRIVVLLTVASVSLSACSAGYGYGSGGSAPGGDTTSDVYGAGAFSQPATNLTDADVTVFRIGDSFFTIPWERAPGSEAERDGLGPTYLATACAGCHTADGRDAALDAGGTPVIRFVEEAGGAATIDETYGLQVQDQAIDGVPAEASIAVSWLTEDGAYADGSGYSLRSPLFDVTEGPLGPLATRPAGGARLAPPLIGLGLLEAIPEEDILALADPDDIDRDGISGRASMVDSSALGRVVVGRFGRKANVATVADQTADAYLFDMGITSPARPTENCPPLQAACAAAASGGTPEISAERLEAVIFYAQTLAVPGRPGASDASVLEGQAVFEELGCAACHTERYVTGSDHPIAAVRNQVIYPYTDLLLHDMGPMLGDGRSDGDAGPTEWKTPALWGLGLTRTVNPDAGFLHDGRARTIEEAVLWHGGEARSSMTAFTELSADRRERLLIFLKSL